LDTPVGDDNESLSSLLCSSAEKSPEGIVIGMERSALIDGVLSQLSPRECTILRRRFGLDGARPETLEKISVTFHLTRERIRQIEDKALRKLRHPSRRRILRELWPAASAESQSETGGRTTRGSGDKNSKQKVGPKGKKKRDSTRGNNSIPHMARSAGAQRRPGRLPE